MKRRIRYLCPGIDKLLSYLKLACPVHDIFLRWQESCFVPTMTTEVRLQRVSTYRRMQVFAVKTR